MEQNSTTFKFDNSDITSEKWNEKFEPNNSDLLPDNIHQKWYYKDLNTSNIYLQWVQNKEVVSLPKNSFYINYGKRFYDLTIAILVIIFILSWLVPVMGILISIESSGPFFFVQYRSGKKGRQFPCLKFRTMYCAPKTGKFQQTARNDNRITPLGRFLRRTNLDEMPQFINVLTGDMSIVGPRPHAVSHDAIHWTSSAYRERYWVKPGITGIAQIRGARGATINGQTMEHRVRYDHFYIPRQTFLLDIKICLWTLESMLRGDKNAW